MATAFRDYYEILGVPRTASEDEIKQAYRRAVREYHPDLHGEAKKDVHTKKMQEINEAYAVLSSKEKRATYDQYGEHWQDVPPEGHTPDGQPAGQDARARTAAPNAEAFSDLFRSIFEQSGFNTDAEEVIPSELDVEAALELSLEEAVHGVEKSFSLSVTGLCQNCHGTGRKNKTFCSVCGGVGEIRRQRDVRTKIPPGLHDGSRIRLKGQGNEGRRGRGDLFLTIRLRPDARFRVTENNVEATARLMPWDAALGGEISVDTLDGTLRLRVPKETRTGTRLRVAGKGLGKTGDRGDLFVRIEIDIPSPLSAKAEALMKQLKEDAHG